jgi:PAS domain S-box-containing protein
MDVQPSEAGIDKMAMLENKMASAATTVDGMAFTGLGQALLDAMPMPTYLCDSHDVVVACNVKASALWGNALQIGESDKALWTTASLSPGALLEAADAASEGMAGEPHAIEDVEVVLETATGGRIRAFAGVSRLMDGDMPSGIFLKCFRMARPHDDVADLFENGVMGLRFVGADGTILRANQAELDLLGYRHDEYVGHNLGEFDADGDRLARVLERIRAGESVDKYPARLWGGDGRVRHVQISSSGRFLRGEFVHSRCFTVDVSEQERLNRTMRKSDQLSRQLLEALPIAIYTTDAEGKITFFNEAAVDFAGHRPQSGEEWCVSWKLLRLDGTPLPHDQCPMAIAVREARPIHGDMAIVERPDGSRRTFAAYPTPLFDDDGSLVGAVNMLVDVTEQRETEQALQDLNTRLEQRVLERTHIAEATFMDLHRSERNFALLVGSVVDYAIYMLDPQGMITNWNAGAKRIKGYSAEDVIGTHFSRFYTPEDCARGMPATALATARREGRYNAEGWRVRKDGSRFWASVVVDPIFDQDTLIGFAKITRDVTERMEAEAALIESEYLARGVIDTALDGFAQLDEDGRIVQWNPRAEALFGWSRKEALGQSFSALVVAEQDRERFSDHLQPATMQATSRASARPIEMVSRDDRRIPVELSVSSLSLNGNYRTNIFIRDLSEKILIEAQLRQAQKMEAVGQLTGGLAHDFNNLLQGVIGSLDLIQQRIDEGRADEVTRFVRGALNSANRAAAMTHRLLAFSRRQPLDPRPVLANPLMLSMADLLQRTLSEQVTLEFDLATDLWPTLCDPNQLESAVLNLSINARDAMPKGGRLLIRSRNVETDEARTGEWHDANSGQYICIEVTDNGAGMNAEVVEHAFEPFFTTKASGQGTGLGLSMVYGFARQSNGHCDIHSKPGEGTTIKLYLPRHVATADLQGSEQSAVRTPTSLGKGEIVLVVEDEDVVRHVVVEVLHQLGYTALEAVDGEAGLTTLKSNEDIHLLISDIGLPGMSGRALANASRELRPDLKVLLMTGYSSDASAPRGFAAGMELITKPFTVDALASRLRTMLGERHTGNAP